MEKYQSKEDIPVVFWICSQASFKMGSKVESVKDQEGSVSISYTDVKSSKKEKFKVDKVLARQIFIELNKEALDSKNINFINEFEENNEYAIDSSSV